MCHEWLHSAWKRTPRPVRVSFFSGIAIGVPVYLFALTNMLFLTGDALNNVVFDGDLIWLGRWSSQWLSSLSSHFTIPAVNGLIMILAIAGLSALLVSLFEIRSSVLAFAAAAVMMCSPTVSGTLGFLHNADAYMLAAFLAALGFWLLERCRYGFVPAVLLIATATGTYQACATFVIGMMFVRGVQLLAVSDMDARALMKRLGRYLLCMALALALYYGLTQWFSQRSGMAVGDYQSVTQAASLDTLLALPQNALGCYRDFWDAIAMLSSEPDYMVGGGVNVVFAALTVLMTAFVLHARHRGKPLRMVALCLLMALAPLFLCCIRLFAPEKIYVLMTYSVTGLYLLGIAMMDAVAADIQAAGTEALVKRLVTGAVRVASWVMVACLCACVWVWSVSANFRFYKAKQDYEHMYAQCVAFMDRVEASEDYYADAPILVIGDVAYNSNRTQPDMHESKLYYSFMRECLGVSMPYYVANEIRSSARAIAEMEDFLLMPCFPEEGCVQMIDGWMVVKLSDEAF